MDHTIKRVETIPVSLPLIKPVLMGDNQEIRSSDSLLVRLETASGVTGWGEASAAPKMTGETLLGMKQLVDTQFSQMLLGQNIVDWAMVNDQIQNGIPGNTGAKAACNIALYDLYGKCCNISVSDLLGGRIRRQIPVMTLLANPTIQEDLLDAARYYQTGIRFFKLKIGVKSIEEEIATLNELRRLYGSAVFLSADANAGLCLVDAKLILQGIAQSNLLFFEQALASGDLDGFVKILADAKTDEVLGVHMIGARTADLIAEAVTAMEFRASAEDISRMSHAHPTFAEAIKEAALAATDNRALHV